MVLRRESSGTGDLHPVGVAVAVRVGVLGVGPVHVALRRVGDPVTVDVVRVGIVGADQAFGRYPAAGSVWFTPPVLLAI